MSPSLNQVDAQGWTCVEFLSDLHLHDGPDGLATRQAFTHYLQHTRADAVFLLGDLFEVWVGDDAAQPGSLEAAIAQALRALRPRVQLFFMAGNRDFLLGESYAKQAGLARLADPTVLQLAPNERWLLTHGDAWCLDDTEYQHFRQQVRSDAWQQALLAKPLAERQAIAHAMREASRSRQAQLSEYADVDGPTAARALAQAHAQVLLHGHTHRPAAHVLPLPGQGTATRLVLSDWAPQAQPPRADVIRLSRPDADARWHWQRLGIQDGTPEAQALFGLAARI